jgi:hypothetical protein
MQTIRNVAPRAATVVILRHNGTIYLAHRPGSSLQSTISPQQQDGKGDMTASQEANGSKHSDLEEVRFTLRAPQFVFRQIDAARKLRVGFVSRNTWILEAITEKLQRELLGRAP